jgi:hypothetical protein
MRKVDKQVIDNIMERADLSAMTEAQLLELADAVRPFTESDVKYLLFWLQVLCATD